jgi:hypothetical protein
MPVPAVPTAPVLNEIEVFRARHYAVAVFVQSLECRSRARPLAARYPSVAVAIRSLEASGHFLAPRSVRPIVDDARTDLFA